MGKALSIRFSTQEGKRLFHIACGLDKVLRQLKVRLMRNRLSGAKYVHLTDLVTSEIQVYKEFLDKVYAFFQPDVSVSRKNSQSHNYAGVLKAISEAAPIPCVAVISNEELLPLFKMVKGTDVCIRISEEYGLNNLEAYMKLRDSFETQLNRLESVRSNLQGNVMSLRPHNSKSRGLGKGR